MGHFKIAKTGKDKNTGKRRRLDPHRRIEILGARFPAVADHLLAAKWIGNTGVHAGILRETDIFDAMDQIEYALDELIAKRSVQLRQMANAIKKKKGPRVVHPAF
jgi:hypothetical protein